MIITIITLPYALTMIVRGSHKIEIARPVKGKGEMMNNNMSYHHHTNILLTLSTQVLSIQDNEME